MTVALHESLARLLEYPTADFSDRLNEGRRHADDGDAEFSAFAAAAEGLSRSALEELYIQTFDFNPKCTLDLGWQLFAEDYNRGLFLAKLREISRRLEVPETSELPDHLPHVLRLLARMTAAEAGDFAATCGVPAIEKTLDAIEEGNPYRSLVASVLTRFRDLASTPMEATPS